MIKVMEFTRENKGSHQEFVRCRKCNYESKHKVVADDSITFVEILHNKINEGR